MRYFLTDLYGNPIYSFAHARRLRRSNSGTGLNNSMSNSFDNNNSNYHHYQSNTSYIRQSSYSQHSRRSTTTTATPVTSTTAATTAATTDTVGNVGTNNGSSSSNNTANYYNHTLFCMVRNRAWDEILRRIQKYPSEAYGGQDPVSGNTVLHVACRLDPPPAIVFAFQCHIRIANLEGATPLHIAASHRCSAASIHALLQVAREQQQQLSERDNDDNSNSDGGDEIIIVTTNSATADLTRIGRSPIHYACMSYRGLDIDAFRLLLDATIRDGNLWMEQPKKKKKNNFTANNSKYNKSYGNTFDDDDDDMDDDYTINEHDDEDNEEDTTTNNEEEEDPNANSSDNPIVITEHKEQQQYKYEFQDEYNNATERRDDDTDMEQEHGSEIVGMTKDSSNNNCRPNSNKVLVNVMGLKDATGQTPLTLLFRRYRERVKCVINTLDRLRREYVNDPYTMSIHAAMTVQNDLGQLWDKARWIIARLTEERLNNDKQSLLLLSSQQHQRNDDVYDRNQQQQRDDDGANIRHDNIRNCSNYSNTRIGSANYYNAFGGGGIQSPGEAAVAQEAAMWSTEQQQFLKLLHQQSLLSSINDAATTIDGDNVNGRNNNFEETVTLPSDGASISSSSIVPAESDSTYSSISGARSSVDACSISSGNNNGGDTSTTTSNNSSSSRKFRIVHASVGLTGYGCPPELIRLAISIYPHQVLEMDEDGNLPLHLAVTAPASHFAPTAMEQCYHNNHNNFHTSAMGDDHSVISDAAMSFFSTETVSQTTNPFDKVIKMLLQHYPQAARIPHGKSGQLPLVMAVDCGRRTWEDGLRTLLNAYPPALHNKKLIFESTFYPQILALVANNGYACSSSTNQSDGGIAIFDFIPSSSSSSLRGGGCGAMSNNYSINNINSNGLVLTSKSAKQQKRRHQACARTTLFDLLRTKPEWITKGFEDEDSIKM